MCVTDMGYINGLKHFMKFVYSVKNIHHAHTHKKKQYKKESPSFKDACVWLESSCLNFCNKSSDFK